MKKTISSNEFDSIILGLYRSGMSESDIGKKFKLIETVIVKRLRRMGAYNGMGKYIYKDRIHEIVGYRAKGKSIKYISEVTGIPFNALKEIIEDTKEDIERERYNIIEEIKRLRESGLSSPEISNRLGVSVSRIRTIYRDNDIRLMNYGNIEKDTLDNLIDMYNRRVPLVDMSKELHMSIGKIYRALRDNGIPLNSMSAKAE